MDKFMIHNKRIVTGAELQKALFEVANDWRESVIKILEQDHYASHVTQAEKEHYFTKGMEFAHKIETGDFPMSFTIWQRINEKLTGECVALLP
jgi:hypothetical protein